MAERVLTERELNRAVLARQLLLERAKLPVPRALERVGGLQTQDARSGYIGLWSRLAGFVRDDLTRALERHSVVQATLMRVTIHTVSARDYPLLTEGVREERRKSWAQARSKQMDVRKVPAVARKVSSLLADGPRWRKEVVEELGVDSATWNGVGMWVDLVRVPPSGTWERPRGDLYATAETWLDPSKATEEEGLEHLVRRYLGGFGPASLKDAANWAGLPPRRLEPVVERMNLRRFRAEDGAELLDLPRAPLPDGETPAPPRFLPAWDATLLAHARRAQILPERHRAKVFNTKTPHSLYTFLVDGQAAGIWKLERGRVRIEPFERLTREARKEVDEEAARLAAFLA
ncbi:MAG TPA: winged helix DNA-binding domain-containing protein [Gaiellaceae bacterium]